MFDLAKKFSFFSLMIISSITLINIAVLYWFPLQIPLSSYLAVNLMRTSYFLKAYYLIPIVFSLCIVMFFSALSFLKNRILLPVFSFIYLLCDLILLGCSFFDSWFNNEYFIPMQAITITINITVIVFMCIYFIFLGRQKIEKRKKAD